MPQMQIFYSPDITGDNHILEPNESKHIIRVLRMTKGTAVKLIDGKGNLFEGMIEDPDPKRCSVSIRSVIRNFEKRDYRLHIAISPLKNAERFEWFIEKSVEIGIDGIIPLICRNTEKPGIKVERINNLIISAMKQSLKAFRPVLGEPVSFDDFIGGDLTGKRMIAHCNELFERKKITDALYRNDDAVILIGPEGDFSIEEITKASAKGYENIHLGKSRLRTETGGIAACHSVYLINL